VPVVLRSGLSFHFQLLGAGPPVCMLHGLLVGNLATWYFGAAARLARDHRVLLYDLRGHGKSERAERGYDTTTLAADLDALLPLAGDGAATLVGHSWGALVALRFALARPDRVARLVLVEAPLPPASAVELTSFMGLPPEEMARAMPGSLQQILTSRQGRLLVERMAFLCGKTSLLADLAAEPDFDDAALARLGCPVLLVYGDRSRCRPAADRLARVLPSAELVVLPGGHFLPAEAPEEVGAAVERFVRG
jgi:pimeloyl-ACP methyl ester carboxylesterase